ncbi:MAG: LexA family transcriptional regulator [Fimbriimonadaceae bacterium]|nr:LexA family transcriptional regulator [Chitinophagales bacterium]
MTEGNQLKQAVKNAGYTDQQFSEMLGVSRQTLSTWYGKSQLNAKAKQTVKKFLDINFTGKDFAVNSTVNEPEADFEVTNLHKSKATEKKLPTKAIPIYRNKGSAGAVQMYDDINEADGSMIIPGYEDCDFAITAFGHSMYPVIENGCLVLCRRVNNKQLIQWGEIYFVRTKDYQMIKRLQQSDIKGHLSAVSENDERRRDDRKKFEAMEIPVDEIMDIYLIKGVIKKLQI